MMETGPPLAQEVRAGMRMQRLAELHTQANRLALQIRQETVALVEEDTPFALRVFVADELSLELAESPGTCKRWIDDARVLVAHPQVMALVGDGQWGIRHADAVLDELAGASAEVQQQVLALVLGDDSARTPHQLRKATRAARLLHDLQHDSDKQDRIHDRRGVSLIDEYDGSATLMVGGTKTGGAQMLAAIDAHVAVPTPGDTRSLSQRRYDFVMDLLCGRVQVTAPWQALIVVSLDTLEGGDAPAEIPGLGLVSAAEAREVLAQADLRRAVVDESGALVSLDDQVLTGDQAPLRTPAPTPVGEPEPAPTDDPEPTASADDQQWLADQLQQAQTREAQLLSLCAHGLAQITTHLREQALAAAGWTVTRWNPQDPGPPEAPDPDDDPDGGPPRPGPHRPGGDGRGNHDRPPTRHDDPDPEPEPPTWADRDWLHLQEDQARTHDQLDALAHAHAHTVLRQTVPAGVAPSLRAQQQRQQRVQRQAQLSRWSTPQLRAAVSRLRTDTPTPIPAASKGYPFRGRLARWIRTRDVTCTFPGCTLLAQRCELDHVVEYPKGATEACNGACECVHHHQCKHATMTVTRLTDGTIRWTSRFGTTIDRPPRPLLRGW